MSGPLGSAPDPKAARVPERPPEADHALAPTPATLSALVDSIDQMVWSTRPDGFHDYFNERWYAFTGVPPGTTDGEGWSEMFHPEDRDRARAVWRRSLDTGEPYYVQYRLRHRSGDYRWVIGRAQPVRDESGAITRWYGTCTDVHELKVLEEQRDLIARELSHRIKNIFAVVSSLVTLSARDDEAAKPFARTLQARLDALARAHVYVQPYAPEPGPDLSYGVHGLVSQLLEPYAGTSAAPPCARRIALEGEDAPIGPRAATALALIIHELATNAVKYGALSAPEGTVRITGRLDGGTYRLRWRERGGPPVAGPPARRGFGTLLAERSATAQLGATLRQDWAAEGLTFEADIPVTELER